MIRKLLGRIFRRKSSVEDHPKTWVKRHAEVMRASELGLDLALITHAA